MGIFNAITSGNGKQKWTKEQDAMLVQLANEGKDRKTISAAVKHPENSITYRVRFIKAAEVKAIEAGTEINSVEDLLKTIKY